MIPVLDLLWHRAPAPKRFRGRLTSRIVVDEEVALVCRSFDYDFSGESSFDVPNFEAPKTPWTIGLVVGPSGSGKTQLLKHHFRSPDAFEWDRSKAVVSQMPDAPTERLMGAGLNSIPSWCKPFHVLSNGEQFRADVARRLENDAVFDEFTSVVDRNVAKSCAFAVQRFIRSKGIKRVVFATCHDDVEEWLCPDWVFDTRTGGLYPRDRLCRPHIEIRVHKTTSDSWGMFGKHHYLTESINRSARCFLATWNGVVVGFASALSFPNGNFKNAWREHRTVILPDFQGLGLGVRLSDFVAEHFVKSGHRYFSKTSHPRMGGYREESPKWRATSKNRKSRPDYAYEGVTKEDRHKKAHAGRVCYSHEFVGTEA